MVNAEIFIALGVCVAVTGVIYILQIKKKQQQVHRKKEEEEEEGDENKNSVKSGSKIEELDPQINESKKIVDDADKPHEEAKPELNIEVLLNNNHEEKAKDNESHKPTVIETVIAEDDIVLQPIIPQVEIKNEVPIIEIIKPNIEENKREEPAINLTDLIKPVIEEVEVDDKSTQKPSVSEVVNVIVPPVVSDGSVTHDEKKEETASVPLIPLIPATIIEQQNKTENNKAENIFVAPILPPVSVEEVKPIINENSQKVEEKKDEPVVQPEPVKTEEPKKETDEVKNNDKFLAPIIPVLPVVEAEAATPVTDKNGKQQVVEEKTDVLIVKPEVVEEAAKAENESADKTNIFSIPILPPTPSTQVNEEPKPVTNDATEKKKDETVVQPETVKVEEPKEETNDNTNKFVAPILPPTPAKVDEETKPATNETKKEETVVQPEVKNEEPKTENNAFVTPLLKPTDIVVNEESSSAGSGSNENKEELKNQEQPASENRSDDLVAPLIPPPPVPIANGVNHTEESKVNGNHSEKEPETPEVEKNEHPVIKPEAHNADTVKAQEDAKALLPEYERLRDCGFGKIDVTIFYDEKRSRFCVSVHSAQNLRNVEKNGLSDPYTRMTLQPDAKSVTKKKTRVIQNSLNPKWDEEFEWTMTKAEAQTKTLELIVKDEKSIFTRQETVFLGKLLIELKSADIYKQPLKRSFWLQPEHQLSQLIKEKVLVN